MESSHNTLPESVVGFMDEIRSALSDEQYLADIFDNCFTDTLTTTMKRMPDGTVFVITGDIPAMWLRDSAAQVRPYLILAQRDPAIAGLVAGVVKRQIGFILKDPYANAFNEGDNGHGHQADGTDMSPGVWERKYEIDSLCYPLQLAYLLWKATGMTSHLDAEFLEAARAILDLWRKEQDHMGKSDYSFQRRNCPPTDTLGNGGKGAPVAPTGMTWSGFRPSDDACTYGYLVPANMFAVVVLGYLAEMAEEVLDDPSLAAYAKALRAEIDGGIREHAVVDAGEFGRIFAYETDGMGNHNLMDDANVPSLLSLPYLGYCSPEDPIYLNTRKFILSKANPYYFEGKAAQGVGSPHTPARYIWHISLAIQGLSTRDKAEKERILRLMAATDAGKKCMHEGFDVDDPDKYTREWFSWANMMYCELLLDYLGIRVPASPMQAKD